MQQCSFRKLVFDRWINAGLHKYWNVVDAHAQTKIHLTNIIRAVDAASGDCCYTKKLTRVKSNAKAISEVVQMKLIKAQLVKEDIKDAQERGIKRKREYSE